jgi:hypothetical protein
LWYHMTGSIVGIDSGPKACEGPVLQQQSLE